MRAPPTARTPRSPGGHRRAARSWCSGWRSGPWPRSRRRSPRLVRRSSSAAKTRETRPSWRASSASTVRPVSNSSRALASPTALGSRYVAAMPGFIPSLTKGAPSLAPCGGVADVAGQGQAETGADRVPVDRGDRGHLEPPDREPGPVERHHPGAQVVDLGVGLAGDPAGVAAGAERAALPGDHHDAHRAVGRQLVDRSHPGGGHLLRHRVALGRVVEDQPGHAGGRALQAKVS